MKSNKRYSLDIVIPCFNEAGGLANTITLVMSCVQSLLSDPEIRLKTFRLILVDDGSRDQTWALIAAASARDQRICGIRLSRNFGHQSALIAGLENVDADACISMDADLQHDVGAIRAMLLAFQDGADLALGVRENRQTDTIFKRGTAYAFYASLRLLGVGIVANHADYRLMSRRALDGLLAHKEVNLFLRGLIPSLGFNVILVPYTCKSRAAGKTKYSLRKMIGLALNGATSFSMRPLRLIGLLGLLVCAISAVSILYVLVIRFAYPERAIAGWASTVLPIFALGGVQILSIGVLGEYIGKIYMEVKRRPRYLIQDSTERGGADEKDGQRNHPDIPS